MMKIGYKVNIENIPSDLSAGLCDNCDKVMIINHDGYQELICSIKRTIIEPVSKNDQVKKCDNYNRKAQ